MGAMTEIARAPRKTPQAPARALTAIRATHSASGLLVASSLEEDSNGKD